MNNNKQNRVIIKKEAFRNMITHLLRFGNIILRRRYDVLGICIGNISENNDIIINNAIPITHGKGINLNTDNYLLEKIAQIKEKYNASGLKGIGNYISHVDNGLSLSERDINNLLQFQNEDNPLGFCVAFDPNLIDKNDNFGLKIYTLDDFHQGINSQYHELPYEIEKPNSLDYFKWVQKFVEDYQKEDPILIKEIIELSEDKQKDLQEIPKTKEKMVEELFYFSNFKEANVEFGDTVERIMNQQIIRWTEEFNSATLSGNQKLLESIIQIKENISRGLINYKKVFEEEFKIIFNIFEESLSSSIDTRIQDFNKIIEDTKRKYTMIKESLIESIKNQVTNNYRDFQEIMKKFSEMSEFSKNQMKNLAEKAQILNESIITMPEQIKNNFEEIIVKLQERAEKNNIEIMELFNNLYSEIELIENTFSEIKNRIEEKIKKIENL